MNLILLVGVVALGVVGAFLFGAVIKKRNIHIWLFDYLFGKWRRPANRGNPTHIVFCYVDHFEPHHGGVSDDRAQQRMRVWLDEYPTLAAKFVDADGCFLKHTWFYPYDELDEQELEQLNVLCRQGLGEVEFHLHHKDDTSQSLRAKLLSGLEVFNRHDIAITEDGEVAYGFIHGNWALDNSIHVGGRNFCGVNDEISILKETGCFADFTFPAYLETSQPRLVNSIFYATDDPSRPKSHHSGPLSKVGIDSEKFDLLIVQGPMMLNWKRRRRGVFPNIEDGNIHEGNGFDDSKVDLWVHAGIHVEGREDWVFVKVFTHGAPEKNHEQVLGSDADRLFSYLTEKYNDGKNHVLHFVTAREMFNIIKAAEDGKSGNPNSYRDYVVQRYKNTL